MNFLKLATVAMAFSGIALADNYPSDFEKIETLDGMRYDEIFIVDADENGLMFRHRQGIAKLDYGRLPMNLRMLYEPVQEEAIPGQGSEKEGAWVAATEALPAADSFAVELSTRSRLIGYGTGVYVSPGFPCARVPWKSHWPRYHSAHSLVDPYCRAAATLDFLYTAGLLPRPRGIVTVRLPHGRPYLY